MFLESLAEDFDHFESFKIFCRTLHSKHGNQVKYLTLAVIFWFKNLSKKQRSKWDKLPSEHDVKLLKYCDEL